jgi:hypothetical protein
VATGYTLRQKVGALVLDWPRFEWALRTSWVRVRNRRERLIAPVDDLGFACGWQWTSDLHVAKVFPVLGARLLKAATAEWPILFAEAPADCPGDVDVSFVIGHRGAQRTAQLLATLATVAAQRGAACECIVVEQSGRPELPPVLPSWVRYVCTPPATPGMPYSRAWAFNVGARQARGRILVLHDNDMLVPAGYAREIRRRVDAGDHVVNLKRFIFYLGQEHSRGVAAGTAALDRFPPVSIMQNAEAGGSIAITRDGYDGIGGFDESFVGWGGEDNEFWDRARSLRVWPYGYLPMVHLWHAPQAQKPNADRATIGQYRRRSALPVPQRIAELRARCSGSPEGPDPAWPPASDGR